jgi:protein TonB
MFEDSLIESGGKLKTARGWTSIVSFLIQFMIIGVMVLIPLIFTEALPKSIQLGFLVAPRRLHHRRRQLLHRSKL